MSVKLLALRSGFTTLTVTYQYKDIILRSMVTVGAYHPLKVSYELTLRYADVAWELQVLCCLRLWNVTTNFMDKRWAWGLVAVKDIADKITVHYA